LIEVFFLSFFVFLEVIRLQMKRIDERTKMFEKMKTTRQSMIKCIFCPVENVKVTE